MRLETTIDVDDTYPPASLTYAAEVAYYEGDRETGQESGWECDSVTLIGGKIGNLVLTAEDAEKALAEDFVMEGLADTARQQARDEAEGMAEAAAEDAAEARRDARDGF